MDHKFLEDLILKLKDKKLTLSIAESITAGLAISKLGSVKGISDVLLGGVISYKKETKIDILDVDPKLIEEKTAESSEVTTAMTKGLKSLFKSDITVGVTGAASEPSKESNYKLKVPVGKVFLTIIFKDKVHEFDNQFDGNPDQIREKTVNFIYEKISELVS